MHAFTYVISYMYDKDREKEGCVTDILLFELTLLFDWVLTHVENSYKQYHDNI